MKPEMNNDVLRFIGRCRVSTVEGILLSMRFHGKNNVSADELDILLQTLIRMYNLSDEDVERATYEEAYSTLLGKP